MVGIACVGSDFKVCWYISHQKGKKKKKGLCWYSFVLVKDRIKSNKHHLSLRVVVITIWGQSSYYKFKVSLPFTVILYLFCSPVFLKYGSNFTCRNIWSVSTKLFFYEVSKHGFCPLELESSWSFFFWLNL